MRSFLSRIKYQIVGTVKKISQQEAQDKGFFGPVYHGTSSESQGQIENSGFKVFIGKSRAADVRNGYLATSYADGKPAPIHHLGFGMYFTTSQAVAKQFKERGLGLKSYYLDVPRLETINFGSPNTMMKWWVKNGYDIEQVYPIKDLSADDIENLRVNATKNLTNTLKKKYDAVWFKGKGLRRLLDGDQICVFDTSRIYQVDESLAKEGDVGSLVQRKSDGMKGTITNKKPAQDYRDRWNTHSEGKPHPWVKPETQHILQVKWKKGGTQFDVQDVDVEPVGMKPKRTAK